MSPTNVRLGEVAEFIRGINFKPDDVVELGTPGSVACMRTKNVQHELDLSDIWAVDASFVRRANQYLQFGDVLVSSANSWNLVGKCCWIPNLSWKTTFGGFISVLRPDRRKVDPRFLFHWFASERIQALLRSFGQKTTNISNLNFERTLNLELALPPLCEQRRIAEVLDRADALRAKRRAAQVQLEGLAQSIFLEMFGDPLKNPLHWPVRQIGEIGKVATGNTPPRSNPEFYGAHIEWIKSDNINSPDDYLTRASEGLSEAGARLGRIAPVGSILVTCIAGSPDCIGNAAIADRPVAFNQQINALIPQLADTRFLYVQLLVGKKLIQQASTTGMKGIVSKSRFEAIKILVPPLALQREFARRVEAVERMKAAQRASVAELDALFASLQHRAFRGEL